MVHSYGESQMHTIDEFQCTECGQTHKKIPVKEVFPPNEKHDHIIITFDCPNCKTQYSAESIV